MGEWAGILLHPSGRQGGVREDSAETGEWAADEVPKMTRAFEPSVPGGFISLGCFFKPTLAISSCFISISPFCFLFSLFFSLSASSDSRLVDVQSIDLLALICRYGLMFPSPCYPLKQRWATFSPYVVLAINRTFLSVSEHVCPLRSTRAAPAGRVLRSVGFGAVACSVI